MKSLGFSRYAFIGCASAALLAGCGGSQPPIGVPPAIPQSPAIGTHAERAESWMAAGASRHDLLYISSTSDGSVYIYTYPQGRLFGTLTGFQRAYGECSDSKGDVFITQSSTVSSAGTIYEYAHGGTTPIAVLSDPEFAYGCSVDPTTGNLAVSGSGLAVYQNASGNPTLYHSSEFAFYYCSYDNQGNLFLTGTDGRSLEAAQVIRLAHNSSTFEQISLNAKLYSGFQWPSVQWEGSRLIVTSNPPRRPTTVYRLRISGSGATITGSTTLDSIKNYYSGQTWIQGKTAVGVGMYKRGYQSVFFWRFPQGGQPKSEIDKVGGTQQTLWGVTVSNAPPR